MPCSSPIERQLVPSSQFMHNALPMRLALVLWLAAGHGWLSLRMSAVRESGRGTSRAVQQPHCAAAGAEQPLPADRAADAAGVGALASCWAWLAWPSEHDSVRTSACRAGRAVHAVTELGTAGTGCGDYAVCDAQDVFKRQ